MEKDLRSKGDILEAKVELTGEDAEVAQEVPAALTEVIGEKATAEVAKLDKKSQNFVAALYEGIGALDAEDRVWINQSDKISERLTAKINGLIGKRDVLQKEADEARAKASKGKEDLEALATTMQEMGKELSADARTKIEAEIQTHADRATRLDESMDGLEVMIEQLQFEEKKNRDWGESKRQGIDGRLSAKQEINQEAIDRFAEAKRGADAQLAANTEQLTTLSKQMETLTTLKNETPTESVKAEIQKLLGNMQVERNNLEAANAKLQEKSTDLQRSIGSREFANKLLQAERDAIWPKDEPAEPDPAKAAEVLADLVKAVEDGKKQPGPPDLTKAKTFLSDHGVDTSGMSSAADMLGAYNKLVNKNTAGKAPPKSIFSKLKAFFGFGAKAESSHE